MEHCSYCKQELLNENDKYAFFLRLKRKEETLGVFCHIDCLEDWIAKL